MKMIRKLPAKKPAAKKSGEVKNLERKARILDEPPASLLEVKKDSRMLGSEITSPTVTVTSALADRWLRLGEFELQRFVNWIHVHDLMWEFRQGRFQEGTPIVLARIGERYYVINGQHTLLAIRQTGIAIKLTVIEYSCENLEQVGIIYSRWDIQAVRTASARLKALGILDAFQINTKDANSLTRNLKLLYLNFRHYRSPVGLTDEQRGVMKSAEVWEQAFYYFDDEIRAYLSVLEQCENRSIRARFLRGGVAAVALATLKANATWKTREGDSYPAIEFWASAAKNSGLLSSDPAARLHTWLITSTTTGQRPDGIAGQTASCWNKAHKGSPLDKVRDDFLTYFGVTVLGTRYKAAKKPKALRLTVTAKDA